MPFFCFPRRVFKKEIETFLYECVCRKLKNTLVYKAVLTAYRPFNFQWNVSFAITAPLSTSL